MATLVPDLKKFIVGLELKGGVASVSESTWRKIAGMINFLGHRSYQEKNFFLNGAYGNISATNFPFLFADGLAFFEFDAEIFNIWTFNVTPGSSGTTELDLKLKPKLSGAFTSILSTTAKIHSTAPAGRFFEIGDVGADIVAPVLVGGTPKNVNQGDALRLDIIQAMPGASNAGLVVHYRPR